MNDKIEKIQTQLKKDGKDGLLIETKAMKKYLQTLTGSGCKLFVTQTEVFLLVDGRYYEQAKQKKDNMLVVLVNREAIYPNAYEWIIDFMKSHKMSELAIESSIDLKTFLYLKQQVKISFYDDLLLYLRSKKDAHEIQKIESAIHLSEQIYYQVISEIKVGMTDYEISAKLQYYAISAGAAGMSFDTIIGIGEKSAYPHVRPSGSYVQKNEPIMIDFGIIYDDYQSDMTRIVCVGEPKKQIREIHQVVVQANEAGIASMKAGVLAKEADLAARKVIEEAGYGPYFTHGLGHGIGLDNSNELPKINQVCEMALEDGMVMSCEPGIYIPSVGGIRIEDVVLIDHGKPRILTSVDKEIKILEEK
ncbi:M24 family metallopeptidase [Enterococcus camelliae]|uniref:M24 family metallopeptidase n=1 Tax=Enterococcus camelliae TaxID=453959 RepID=A0ABW5TJD5_9ENTE